MYICGVVQLAGRHSGHLCIAMCFSSHQKCNCTKVVNNNCLLLLQCPDAGVEHSSCPDVDVQQSSVIVKKEVKEETPPDKSSADTIVSYKTLETKTAAKTESPSSAKEHDSQSDTSDSSGEDSPKKMKV